jgi:hypothetical protein
MQDSTTPHTAKETIRELSGEFGKFNGDGKIISKGLWFPRSPDLNPCDFFCGENSKASNPHDLEALKQNICEVIYNSQHHEMQQVS